MHFPPFELHPEQFKTKKLGSFAECFVFVLAMNDILYQHVTKPQLTSGIEGYDVYEHRGLANRWEHSASWGQQENATYTTMYIKLDYTIPRLLQYVGDT